MASACPGGTGENDLLLTGTHLKGEQEQREFVDGDHRNEVCLELQ